MTTTHADKSGMRWVEVVGWAVVSAVGFWMLYAVQRSLFLNGLSGDPTEFPHPLADFAAAQQDLRRYWLLIAITGAAYVGLLVRAHQWGRAAWGAVAIAVLGHLALLFARPSLSIDILSYLSHGYWTVEGNRNQVLAFSWQRTDHGAMVGCAAVAVVALAVLPTYWPWYPGLALALLVLRPIALALAQVVVITAGSRIAGPYGDLGALGYVDFVTMFNLNALWGITIPVAAVLLLTVFGIARGAGSKRVRLWPGSGQP